MAYITNNGHKIAYGIKKFVVDTAEEIKGIPILSTILPGSKVLVATTSQTFILTPDYQWLPISSNEAIEEGVAIIYDGGNINKN